MTQRHVDLKPVLDKSEMIYTTLNSISSLSPPKTVWGNLLTSLNKTQPDDEAISILQVLHISGLGFALECCQLVPKHDNLWRRYAVWCARQIVWPMMYPEGPSTIAVAERFAYGKATSEEFNKVQASMAWLINSPFDGYGFGKIAAATTHEIAGLGAKIAAESAALSIAHYAGIKARLATQETGDDFVDACELAGAYDSARSKAYESARDAQKEKFARLLSTLSI